MKQHLNNLKYGLLLLAVFLPPLAMANPIYFKGEDADTEDRYGQSVVIGDDILFIGASGDDTSRFHSPIPNDEQYNNGIVYVYRKNALGNWQYDNILIGSDTDTGDQFGSRLAFDGIRLVVGAIGADNNRGAAYVFSEDSNGNWLEEAKLSASNGEGIFDNNQLDKFGNAVAIDGNTIVVGANGEASANANDPADNSATRAGAAYVFEFNGTNWLQTAYLKSDNIQATAIFGESVAISDDHIWVGAPYTDYGSDNSVGRVVVFRKDSSGWAYHAGYWGEAAGVRFGTALASNADFIAVSATHADVAPLNNVGKVTVVDIVSDNWSSPAEITAAAPLFDMRLGSSLAFSNDHLVVGAARESGNGTGVNPSDDGSIITYSGAAYVFARQVNGDWLQTHRIKASNTDANDLFASDVAMHDGEILIGAYSEDSNATGIDGDASNNDADNAGAAYLYTITIPTFSVGGTISGLDNGQTLMLYNNGGDPISSGNGSFTFPTELSAGSTYAVTLTEPAEKTCTLSNASGTINGVDITDVHINCVSKTYVLGGSVTGINIDPNYPLNLLDLENTSNGETLSLGTDGAFMFTTELTAGEAFDVAVTASPIFQTCNISDGQGIMPSGGYSAMMVTCSQQAYTLGGRVNFLTGSVVLENDAGEQITLTNSDPADAVLFSFSADYYPGDIYSLRVISQPSDQDCGVGRPPVTGTFGQGNVSNLIITCFDLVDISTSVTGDGSLSPTEVLGVAKGSTHTFTLSPANGWTIAGASGCGGSLSGDTYTTAGVLADCTVSASFTRLGVIFSDSFEN